MLARNILKYYDWIKYYLSCIMLGKHRHEKCIPSQSNLVIDSVQLSAHKNNTRTREFPYCHILLKFSFEKRLDIAL